MTIEARLPILVKIPAVENPQTTTGILGYDRIYRDWQILSH